MLSLLDFKRERINKMRQSLIQSERSKAGADLLFVKGAVLHLTDRQLIPLRLLKLPVCVFCVCLWLIRVHTLACCKRKTFLSGNFFLFFFWNSISYFFISLLISVSDYLVVIQIEKLVVFSLVFHPLEIHSVPQDT